MLRGGGALLLRRRRRSGDVVAVELDLHMQVPAEGGECAGGHQATLSHSQHVTFCWIGSTEHNAQAIAEEESPHERTRRAEYREIRIINPCNLFRVAAFCWPHSRASTIVYSARSCKLSRIQQLPRVQIMQPKRKQGRRLLVFDIPNVRILF